MYLSTYLQMALAEALLMRRRGSAEPEGAGLLLWFSDFGFRCVIYISLI